VASPSGRRSPPNDAGEIGIDCLTCLIDSTLLSSSVQPSEIHPLPRRI